MDGEGLNPDSDFPLPECALGVDGRVDRISQLPNEILFLILSLLPVRKAAATTILSSRWLDLWKQIPNLKFNLKSDRISQLPDNTLIVILSFLRLRAVAATSVLSSRWSDLWKHSPYLDFNHDHWDMGDRRLSDQEHIEIVNSVIQSHKALSLKQFRICFNVDKSSKTAFTKWLEFVFSRQVESLELDLSILNDSDMLVLEESLREMSITCGAPQTLFFCQSLKKLFLKSLKVGGQDVELFLRNCPLLEILIINSAVLTSDVEVCGTSDLMLKYLGIRKCRGKKSIKVSAPNLTWISLWGNSAKLLLEDVPRLEKAEFLIRDPDFVQEFAHISQLQVLLLTLRCPMPAFWTNGFPQMPNLRKLFIMCHESHHYSFLQIIALIWASPCLDELSIMAYGNPQVPSVLMNGERSKHQNLQVFRMSGVPSASDDMVELVIYILDNCVALREVTISKWHPRDTITDEMRAAANNLQQKLQGKLIANHIQLQFFGCNIVL